MSGNRKFTVKRGVYCNGNNETDSSNETAMQEVSLYFGECKNSGESLSPMQAERLPDGIGKREESTQSIIIFQRNGHGISLNLWIMILMGC